jgi:hypothetical protein
VAQSPEAGPNLENSGPTETDEQEVLKALGYKYNEQTGVWE